MAWTQVDVDKLKAAIAQGATKVKFADREVTYRSLDEMRETAQVLGGAALNKTIVLTGAMVPYAFGSSDGLFNLGSALSFVQVLPAGVYVAMNGQQFRWDCVRKNRASGCFEAI